MTSSLRNYFNKWVDILVEREKYKGHIPSEMLWFHKFKVEDNHVSSTANTLVVPITSA